MGIIAQVPVHIQARQMSSGTIATLTGFKMYNDIDQVQYEFIEFCEENTYFENWIAAWNEYKAVTTFNFPNTIKEVM